MQQTKPGQNGASPLISVFDVRSMDRNACVSHRRGTGGDRVATRVISLLGNWDPRESEQPRSNGVDSGDPFPAGDRPCSPRGRPRGVLEGAARVAESQRTRVASKGTSSRGATSNKALERTAPGSGRIGIAAPPLSAVFGGPSEVSTVCEGLREALSSHLPGCRQCEDAHRSVSGVLDAGELRFPCADGLALINGHLDTCAACSAELQGSRRGLAALLRAPEGPAN